MPVQDFHVRGPIQQRTFHLAHECQVEEGHQHHYDHTTVVTRGRIRVYTRWEQDGKTIEGTPQEYGEGEDFECPAHVWHNIKALEPDTRYMCIFSHRDFDGRIVQHYTGHPKAAEAKQVEEAGERFVSAREREAAREGV